MIQETGQVISVDADAIWVETIQQSACQSCAAQKGCGQRLLSKTTGQTTAIRVLPGQHDPRDYGKGDSVTIGIPEQVIVKGTLLVYLLPLLTMLLGVFSAAAIVEKDYVIALGAVIGLLFGGLLVRLHAFYNRHNCRLQPILLK